MTFIVFILGALPSIGLAETEQHFYLCSSLKRVALLGSSLVSKIFNTDPGPFITV